LIAELPDIPNKLFNSGTVNMNELILGGHSFGGNTALYTATRLSTLKAVWCFDPWMFAFHEEFSKGTLQVNVPTIIITSETFSPSVLRYGKYDNWQCCKDILHHSKSDKNENILIKETGHLHQCDYIVLNTIDMFIL